MYDQQQIVAFCKWMCLTEHSKQVLNEPDCLDNDLMIDLDKLEMEVKNYGSVKA